MMKISQPNQEALPKRKKEKSNVGQLATFKDVSWTKNSSIYPLILVIHFIFSLKFNYFIFELEANSVMLPRPFKIDFLLIFFLNQ